MNNIKNILFTFFCVFIFSNGFAQIYDPVKWKTEVKQVSDTEFELISIATIEDGWHVYSQKATDGPIPTSFTYNTQGDKVSLQGSTLEEEGHTVFDKVFNMTIKYFENKASFRQRIKVNFPVQEINGEVEFMVCNDSQCLPPDQVSLNFKLPFVTSQVEESTKKEKDVTPVSHTDLDNSSKKEATVNEEKKSTPITDAKINIEDTTLIRELDTTKKVEVKVTDSTLVSSTKLSNISANTSSSEKHGLLGIFFIAFLSGFAALLTPCVFPMIPMTVSFFTKQSKTKSQGIRNAVFYGISIIVIYVLLGSAVTAIFGADSLNALATNVWFNLIFFLLLVVFAVSFLGAFELVLPSSWGTKIDSKADKGGIIGIFFMALALAIVSFSCTGPIVGTLLVEAASKGGLAPIIGMLGFSMAIALPFALFAAFPGWLNSLPKSGGWLNTVKVVLGFLELALAFKFLSQADLVLQLHWLEREVFIAIWIAIFGTLAIYLFGKIKLPHDSPLSHISVGRLSLGLIVLAFTIYLTPGLWGAPLNLISAFPPPQHYSESPYGVGNNRTSQNSIANNEISLPEGAHLLEPHDIVSFNDYDKGLAYAKQVSKPVMLDFTGWACVNCRKMEQNVWPSQDVLNILKNEVVLISLYVDDKRPLPENEVVDSQLKQGKKLKYIGQKWSELQAIKYGANTQPFYVLMDLNENNLIAPIGYTPDIDAYLNWLKSGISNFNQ